MCEFTLLPLPFETMVFLLKCFMVFISPVTMDFITAVMNAGGVVDKCEDVATSVCFQIIVIVKCQIF